MSAGKRHACNQEPQVECNGSAIDLEGIRARAYRLNYRATQRDKPKADTVDWVEVESKGHLISTAKQTNAFPSIEVRVGDIYTVSVPSVFDREAFTEICKVLTGLSR
jgi:hypothetical protein